MMKRSKGQDDQPQLDFTTGASLRDEGVERVLAHTPEEWQMHFEAAADDLVAAGEPFTIEAVREVVGPPPAHWNAMGGMTRRLVAKGKIRPISFVLAKRKERHAAALRLYVGGAQ